MTNRPARLGYLIAIGVNIGLLVGAVNILDWGWLPFLTADFEQVVPWIAASLLVAAAAYFVYLFDDHPVVKSIGEIITNAVAIRATLELLGVFPFDFSRYSFDWAMLMRLGLILAIVGSGVAIVVAALRLIPWLPRWSNVDPAGRLPSRPM